MLASLKAEEKLARQRFDARFRGVRARSRHGLSRRHMTNMSDLFYRIRALEIRLSGARSASKEGGE